MTPHLAAQQAATARWMGYETADELNQHHDPLHRALAEWAGVPSHAMLDADNRPHDGTLAALEEDAVLRVQRWLQHARAPVLDGLVKAR